MRRWGLNVSNMCTTAQLRLRAMPPCFQPFFSLLFHLKARWKLSIYRGHTSYVTLSACTAMAHISFFMKTISGKANRKQRKIYLRFKLTVFFFKSEVDNCTELWQNNSNHTALSSPYIACIKILFQTLSQRFFADGLKGINSDRWI